ncbi:MAG: hypothetical protein ACKVPX_09065 [Myxococcaceae bacterium]
MSPNKHYDIVEGWYVSDPDGFRQLLSQAPPRRVFLGQLFIDVLSWKTQLLIGLGVTTLAYSFFAHQKGLRTTGILLLGTYVWMFWRWTRTLRTAPLRQGRFNILEPHPNHPPARLAKVQMEDTASEPVLVALDPSPAETLLDHYKALEVLFLHAAQGFSIGIAVRPPPLGADGGEPPLVLVPDTARLFRPIPSLLAFLAVALWVGALHVHSTTFAAPLDHAHPSDSLVTDAWRPLIAQLQARGAQSPELLVGVLVSYELNTGRPMEDDYAILPRAIATVAHELSVKSDALLTNIAFTLDAEANVERVNSEILAFEPRLQELEGVRSVVRRSPGQPLALGEMVRAYAIGRGVPLPSKAPPSEAWAPLLEPLRKNFGAEPDILCLLGGSTRVVRGGVPVEPMNHETCLATLGSVLGRDSGEIRSAALKALTSREPTALRTRLEEARQRLSVGPGVTKVEAAYAPSNDP